MGLLTRLKRPARGGASKYGNQVLMVGGERFDSKKELIRYQQLCLLQRAGEISGLQRQVRYELIPAQRSASGHKEQPVAYIADHVYQEGGSTVVEDAKGYRTADYIIKRKLMLQVYGIVIKEV
ncbi:MAG: DUF1064 domain-containing protein [Candidimonas sp.]|nr:MAG: DUF1064 domain-containing protein [Candidimonas sp.]TAM23746.1 MAG: DUF1064 domain-containing protein [Candidimonas sp.]